MRESHRHGGQPASTTSTSRSSTPSPRTAAGPSPRWPRLRRGGGHRACARRASAAHGRHPVRHRHQAPPAGLSLRVPGGEGERPQRGARDRGHLRDPRGGVRDRVHRQLRRARGGGGQGRRRPPAPDARGHPEGPRGLRGGFIRGSAHREGDVPLRRYGPRRGGAALRSYTVPITRATPDRLSDLAGVLGRAFFADPMIQWPLHDEGTAASITAMFRILYESPITKGIVWEAGEAEGVAVWVPPGEAGEILDAHEGRDRYASLVPDGGAHTRRCGRGSRRCPRNLCGTWTRSPWTLPASAPGWDRHSCATAWRSPRTTGSGRSSRHRNRRTSASTSVSGSASWTRATRPPAVPTSGSCAATYDPRRDGTDARRTEVAARARVQGTRGCAAPPSPGHDSPRLRDLPRRVPATDCEPPRRAARRGDPRRGRGARRLHPVVPSLRAIARVAGGRPAHHTAPRRGGRRSRGHHRRLPALTSRASRAGVRGEGSRGWPLLDLAGLGRRTDRRARRRVRRHAPRAHPSARP